MTLLAAVALALFLVALASAAVATFGLLAGVAALVLASVFALRPNREHTADRTPETVTRVQIRFGDGVPERSLHTPSAYYGVNSLALGEDRIDDLRDTLPQH